MLFTFHCCSKSNTGRFKTKAFGFFGVAFKTSQISNLQQLKIKVNLEKLEINRHN